MPTLPPPLDYTFMRAGCLSLRPSLEEVEASVLALVDQLLLTVAGIPRLARHTPGEKHAGLRRSANGAAGGGANGAGSSIPTIGLQEACVEQSRQVRCLLGTRLLRALLCWCAAPCAWANTQASIRRSVGLCAACTPQAHACRARSSWLHGRIGRCMQPWGYWHCPQQPHFLCRRC